jgi:Swt1-like HEPN
VSRRRISRKNRARRGASRQYADFTEYANLITKADNWKGVFQMAFDRPESVRESFHRLGPVRLCTMHARPITKTELMLASAEITRLLIAIGDGTDADD